MLTKLTLENFQRHRLKEITIGPTVTSIVGPTETGKSAIIRGLTWVCLNSGAVDGFISHGETTTKVHLEVDGHTVTRKKNSRGNSYELQGPNGEEIGTWSAIRKDVPQEVSDLLRTPRVCFQAQHDTPFWLGAGASEVGRAVNALIDLSVIDKALSMANSLAQRAIANESLLSQQFADASNELAGLSWVEESVAKFAALEKRRAKIDQMFEESVTLEAMLKKARDAVAEAQQAQKRADEAKRLLDRLKKLDAMVDAEDVLSVWVHESRNYFRDKDICERSSDLLLRGKHLNKLCADAQEIEKTLGKLDEAQIAIDSLATVEKLLAKSAEISELVSKQKRLENLINTANTYQAEAKQAVQSLSSLQTEIAEMEPEEAEICPTCGQEIQCDH